MERPVDTQRPTGGGSAKDSLRSVMAHFPTGITVVTTRDADGNPLGLTVNSFTSVSLEPPLVLVCINRSASSHDALVSGEGGFTVNILSRGQIEIARRFARRPSEGRFEGIEWRPGPAGNPVLANVAGWLDCTVHDRLPAGDHTIVVGLVTASEAGNAPALLFHRGVMGSAEVGE